jgi:hypothetical protein
VFTPAFFFPRGRGGAAFWAMLIAEAAIIACAAFTNIAFLWYNVIGAVIVVACGLLLSLRTRSSVRHGWGLSTHRADDQQTQRTAGDRFLIRKEPEQQTKKSPERIRGYCPANVCRGALGFRARQTRQQEYSVLNLLGPRRGHPADENNAKRG